MGTESPASQPPPPSVSRGLMPVQLPPRRRTRPRSDPRKAGSGRWGDLLEVGWACGDSGTHKTTGQKSLGVRVPRRPGSAPGRATPHTHGLGKTLKSLSYCGLRPSQVHGPTGTVPVCLCVPPELPPLWSGIRASPACAPQGGAHLPAGGRLMVNNPRGQRFLI